jgi:DNA excision repair protein ERCC-4
LRGAGTGTMTTTQNNVERHNGASAMTIVAPSDPLRRKSPHFRLPAELSPEAVTAVIDTREQLPLDLAPLRSERGTLTTGDYSVAGLESVVAVERKSLPDLLACVGQERERFDREVVRLLAYPVRALVVETTWPELEAGDWRSKVTPAAAVGSCIGWIATGLPIILAGDHQRAGRFVAKLLYTAARRRWREARALAGGVVNREGGGRIATH